jgi:hypothetical protein
LEKFDEFIHIIEDKRTKGDKNNRADWFYFLYLKNQVKVASVLHFYKYLYNIENILLLYSKPLIRWDEKVKNQILRWVQTRRI